MKKILLLVFLGILTTTPVYADRGYRDGHGGGSHGGHGGGWWILPALIGGALLYDLAQPRPVYVQPPPVYVQPPVDDPGYAPSVAPTPVQYWYFCPVANGYYPYVPSCPSGWQRVPTTPPTVIPSTPYGESPR